MKIASLKTKRLLLLILAGVLIPASLVGAKILQDPIKPWMHEEDWSRIVAYDLYCGNSTLIVRGIVSSVVLNHTGFGYVSYHTFPALITLNLTEAVWINDGVWDEKHRAVITVGYDFPEVPNLTVGGSYEVSGFWLSITDSAYSYKLVVAPSIKDSYIKPL